MQTLCSAYTLTFPFLPKRCYTIKLQIFLSGSWHMRRTVCYNMYRYVRYLKTCSMTGLTPPPPQKKCLAHSIQIQNRCLKTIDYHLEQSCTKYEMMQAFCYPCILFWFDITPCLFLIQRRKGGLLQFASLTSKPVEQCDRLRPGREISIDFNRVEGSRKFIRRVITRMIDVFASEMIGSFPRLRKTTEGIR